MSTSNDHQSSSSGMNPEAQQSTYLSSETTGKMKAPLRHRTMVWRTNNHLHVPKPSGPFCHVGMRDFMLGITHTGGVLCRLYYPSMANTHMYNCDHCGVYTPSVASSDVSSQVCCCAGSGDNDANIQDEHAQQSSNNITDGWANWLPDETYLKGFAEVGNRNMLFQALIPLGVRNLKVPATLNAAPFRHIPSGQDMYRKFPVVIFSHGMGGCRTTYSALCIELASYGLVVAAVEHRDNSACLSFLLRPLFNGSSGKHDNDDDGNGDGSSSNQSSSCSSLEVDLNQSINSNGDDRTSTPHQSHPKHKETKKCVNVGENKANEQTAEVDTFDLGDQYLGPRPRRRTLPQLDLQFNDYVDDDEDDEVNEEEEAHVDPVQNNKSPQSNQQQKQFKTVWIRFRHLALTDQREEVYHFRKQQIDFRVRECFRTVNLLKWLNSGCRRNVRNIIDPTCPKDAFADILDLSRMVIMGHSMGGSTALAVIAAGGPGPEQKSEFSGAIALDPWTFPLHREPLCEQIPSEFPLLFINTESISSNGLKYCEPLFVQASPTHSGVRQYLPNRESYTMEGVKHFDQSDISYAFNWFTQYLCGFQHTTRERTFRAHEVFTAKVVHFITRLFDLPRFPSIDDYVEQNRIHLPPSYPLPLPLHSATDDVDDVNRRSSDDVSQPTTSHYQQQQQSEQLLDIDYSSHNATVGTVGKSNGTTTSDDGDNCARDHEVSQINVDNLIDIDPTTIASDEKEKDTITPNGDDSNGGGGGGD